MRNLQEVLVLRVVTGYCKVGVVMKNDLKMNRNRVAEVISFLRVIVGST